MASVLAHGLVQRCSPRHLLLVQSWRSLATKQTAADVDENELAAARHWLRKLDPDTIPRSICEVTFSRSSGPGGQNVNKTSSKATLRVPLSFLKSHVPKVIHTALLRSRYVAAKSDEVVIQSDESRKQADNVATCFRKLNAMIVQAGNEVIPGETSLEQVKRVEMLQKAEKVVTRKMKEFRSSKKSARRGGGRED